MEEYYNPDIFISKDYVHRVFEFGPFKQDLLCSAAATTDFDLTGQIVWPASQVLTWFIISKGVEWIAKANVLEVGAGCGLVGFTAAHLGARKVICSDGSEVILDLLNKNRMAEWNTDLGTIQIESLRWGDLESVQSMLRKFAGQIPNVVLGADVFQSSFGSPCLLFQTVRRVHAEWERQMQLEGSCCPGGADGDKWSFHFYATFALRKTTNQELILECAEAEGFESDDIELMSFLPEGTAPASFSRETIKLFKFTPK